MWRRELQRRLRSLQSLLLRLRAACHSFVACHARFNTISTRCVLDSEQVASRCRSPGAAATVGGHPCWYVVLFACLMHVVRDRHSIACSAFGQPSFKLRANLPIWSLVAGVVVLSCRREPRGLHRDHAGAARRNQGALTWIELAWCLQCSVACTPQCARCPLIAVCCLPRLFCVPTLPTLDCCSCPSPVCGELRKFAAVVSVLLTTVCLRRQTKPVPSADRSIAAIFGDERLKETKEVAAQKGPRLRFPIVYFCRCLPGPAACVRCRSVLPRADFACCISPGLPSRVAAACPDCFAVVRLLSRCCL